MIALVGAAVGFLVGWGMRGAWDAYSLALVVDQITCTCIPFHDRMLTEGCEMHGGDDD